MILMVLMKILSRDYEKDNVCDTESIAERGDNICVLKNRNINT